MISAARDAYRAGEAQALDKQTRYAYFARTMALLLVVLAVVAMPIFAMMKNLAPESFGTYIAPVTGIAGTVVGYWFGTVDRDRGGHQSPPSPTL